MLHVKAIYWAYIDNIRIDIRRKCVSLFLVCNPLIILCQTSFDMTYKEGNYFITSSMNNHGNVEIFVESGLPGVLINEHNYNRLFVDSLYQTVDSSYSKIKSFYGSHSVSKIKYGKVYIGDLPYIVTCRQMVYGRIAIGVRSYSICDTPVRHLRYAHQTPLFLPSKATKKDQRATILPNDDPLVL